MRREQLVELLSSAGSPWLGHHTHRGGHDFRAEDDLQAAPLKGAKRVDEGPALDGMLRLTRLRGCGADDQGDSRSQDTHRGPILLRVRGPRDEQLPLTEAVLQPARRERHRDGLLGPQSLDRPVQDDA